MIKWFIRLILFVVVVFVVLNFAGNMFVAKALSDQLGVHVKVGKLSLDPLHQEAGIFAVKIGNPENFEENLLASIPEISLKIDLKDLIKKQLRIKSIRVHISEITIERNKEGKFNLIELKAVKSSFSQKNTNESDEDPSKDKSTSKNKALDVVMEDVYVAVGRAKYVEDTDGQPIVKEVNLGMKEFALDDVTNLNELVKQIAYKMMQSVGLNQISAVLKNEASEKLNAFMNKVKESMNF